MRIGDESAYFIEKEIIPSALGLLPARMSSPEAVAMLLAIGLQESRFEHRKQIGGPAHGFWQFERNGGVKGVLGHVSTRPIIVPILNLLGYRSASLADERAQCYAAIVHNDVLPCVFARLLLWTLPGAIASYEHERKAWGQYLDAWRPGKPHPETWHDCWITAWDMVDDNS